MGSDFNSIDGIESFLNSVPMFGKTGLKAANFNLGRMRALCDVMHNPQDNLQCIHVAGTNGKGTVCRMLGSVYQSAGYKTGVYTSPHLIDYGERFLINGKMIPDEFLIAFFSKYGDYIKREAFTYFEISTALAFWYFDTENVDIAIIETGLGGRLDATNILTPLISIITSIGLDHTNILGDTIPEIASEKAGIIKYGKPVVIGKLAKAARNEIKKTADKNESQLYEIEPLKPEANLAGIQLLEPNSNRIIKIRRPYQKKVDAYNAAITLQTVTCLQNRFSVTMNSFKEGIENFDTRFPKSGVFNQMTADDKWFFDGAHNSSSVKALTKQLEKIAPPDKWFVVLSFLSDKLNPQIASYWQKFPNVYLYSMPGERAATIDEMKVYFPTAKTITELNSELIIDFKSALVIFSGSFYFYTVISNWLGTNTAS